MHMLRITNTYVSLFTLQMAFSWPHSVYVEICLEY